MTERPELDKLIAGAKLRVDAMSPEEKQEMLREQAISFARGEANWPKPKFHYENGIKVFDSYEDYCNG